MIYKATDTDVNRKMIAVHFMLRTQRIFGVKRAHEPGAGLTNIFCIEILSAGRFHEWDDDC